MVRIFSHLKLSMNFKRNEEEPIMLNDNRFTTLLNYRLHGITSFDFHRWRIAKSLQNVRFIIRITSKSTYDYYARRVQWIKEWNYLDNKKYRTLDVLTDSVHWTSERKKSLRNQNYRSNKITKRRRWQIHCLKTMIVNMRKNIERRTLRSTRV